MIIKDDRNALLSGTNFSSAQYNTLLFHHMVYEYESISIIQRRRL